MPLSKVLVDSSFLVAAYDRDSARHQETNEIIEGFRSQLIVPEVVFTEVVYLLKRNGGVRTAVHFLRDLNNLHPDIVNMTSDDLQRAADIMEQYTTVSFDFVDCCLMALSERLNIRVVFTLDRRDFTIFRPRHIDYLRVLPEA